MRITIGGREVFSRRYRSFDEFMDEYVDHMNERGRRVPDYDLTILITAVAIWLLGQVGEQIISEIADRIRRGKGDDARETSRDAESALTEDDAAAASALLQWAKKENVRIDIVLETEAEGDLKEAFEALIKDVPGSTTED